jgi:drug/metabolite transporter (DMT)-like permease
MPPGGLRARPDLLPSLGIVLSGVLWGLFWLPIRVLGERGLEGGWPGALIYAACLAALLPVVPFRWRTITAYWRPLLMGGLFTGTAFACYATSLLMTEVVRAILLFYLTPVWGTLLGVLLLGERLTAARVTALALGLGGLLVVFGIGAQFPWPRNLGDWLALASGLSWAYGSLRLYRMGSVAVFEQMLSFVAGGLLVIGLGLAFGGAVFGAMPSGPELADSLPFAVLIGLVMLPMLYLTIWPATLLTPGRIGLLLMGDVVVGVVSAALLAGEPFGFREILGTLLILAAGLVEVLGRRPDVPNKAA